MDLELRARRSLAERDHNPAPLPAAPPLLIQFFNLYYDSLHFPVLIACLVWLFVRHRASYGRWRTTLVLFTAISLAVQLIPVAPPRMLSETRLVDTAVLYHQSVYSTVAGFNADQLSAMPSVHVGWAVLVAVAVIATARSRWRWLALLYPAMTTLAVVVTANHFWLDGIVAVVILAVVLAAQALARRLLASRRAPAEEAIEAEPRAGRRHGYGRSSSMMIPSVVARTGATVTS